MERTKVAPPIRMKKSKRVDTEIKMALKEGQTGIGVIRTHERGLHEKQLRHAPFGWDPVAKRRVVGSFDDWDGLTAAQRKTLIECSPVSIHMDMGLRQGTTWTGMTVFTPGNQFNENGMRKAQNDSGVHLKGDMKSEGEHLWMEGDDGPLILEPGEEGATSNAYGRIVIRSKFSFVAGEQGGGFKEIIIKDGPFKGRWIWTNVPAGDGGPGGWLLSRPKDQEPKSEMLREEAKKSMEARILKAEKRLVTGIVLKPEDRDAQRHIYNADVVEAAAHDFVARYNKATRMGEEHRKFFMGQDVQLVESWIVPDDMVLYGKPVAKGTWIITVKVNDDELWKGVKSGDVTGFSVGGAAAMTNG